MREFKTGATRDSDEGKLKVEGFISAIVDHRFSQYMNVHRKQADGKLRDPDNWQKGIEVETYVDSLVRHTLDLRLHWDGFPQCAVEEDIENVVCAIIFNAHGMLHELVKKRLVQVAIEAIENKALSTGHGQSSISDAKLLQGEPAHCCTQADGVHDAL